MILNQNSKLCGSNSKNLHFQLINLNKRIKSNHAQNKCFTNLNFYLQFYSLHALNMRYAKEIKSFENVYTHTHKKKKSKTTDRIMQCVAKKIIPNRHKIGQANYCKTCSELSGNHNYSIINLHMYKNKRVSFFGSCWIDWFHTENDQTIDFFDAETALQLIV